MHNMTMPSAAKSYQSIQIHESEHLLIDLLRDPARYEHFFERYAGAVIMRLAYGKGYEGNEDDVRKALQVVHTVERVASPGAYLVDSFPLLMYLPEWLAPFKREAKRLHEFELTFFRSLLAEVRHKMARGSSAPCFARSFLEKQDSYNLSDDEGAYVLGTLFEAGSGTTASAMMSFILALLHHPAWQTAIQHEVDSVCGTDTRLPTFDDIPQLPTVRAVVKETLRWRPVTAGGVPHELTRDDVYEGIFLARGTNVHANQWAIHRDPTLYPDPETFNPARWLDPRYPTYRTPPDRYPNLQNFSAFGFGRRICPGMNIAENSLHLLAARLAWTIEVRKRDGVEVPLYDYTDGFNVQPKPFVFELLARSEAKTAVLERSWDEGRVKGLWDEVVDAGDGGGA
jgi:cytochrome P450